MDFTLNKNLFHSVWCGN